jgi:hypothetical protein
VNSTGTTLGGGVGIGFTGFGEVRDVWDELREGVCDKVWDKVFSEIGSVWEMWKTVVVHGRVRGA